MYNGKVKGLICFRHERRGHRAEFAEEHRCAEESGLARGLRNLSRRDQQTSGNRRASLHDEKKQDQDEVYRLPGAGFAEKDGTFVNSARWLQWKWAAVPTPGDAKLDQEILARSS